ncbi:NlpC/P60 family protein [Peribacillus frigoritolerans]|uniref:C40 family peptidase n=1 Tax=Peribacillus frigoritolerans TaxID=450367 RepID=UPI00399FE5D6
MFNGKISCMILTLVFMVSFIFLPGIKAEAADPVHTVSSGETVESIAKTYDISAEQLMKTNGLPDDKLFAGQKLTIIQTAYTPSIYQWSERGKKIAKYARSFIGFKKTAGEETPEKGFDSSGLIHWVLSRQNVPVDRLTVDGFYKQGMDTVTPKTGDIIFFLEKDSLKVVTAGIYVGENQFVHSGYGAETVQVRSATEDYFAKYQVAYKTYTPKGEHIVQMRETLNSISEHYSISMSAIKSRNALNTDDLMQGQYLQLYSNPLFPFYVNQEAAYDKAYDVIKYAYTLRGFTYVFGGEDPMTGMDCSGFIYWVMKEQGLSVKRDSAEDYFSLVPKIDNPKAGDLVFFRDTGTRVGVTHVGIYLGEGRFLNSTENSGVHISNLSSGYFAEKFESFGQAESLID